MQSAKIKAVLFWKRNQQLMRRRSQLRWSMISIIFLVIVLRPQIPKLFKGDWHQRTSWWLWGSKYGHCPIRVRTSNLSITGPRAYQLL
jgi:hypothetical protein